MNTIIKIFEEAGVKATVSSTPPAMATAALSYDLRAGIHFGAGLSRARHGGKVPQEGYPGRQHRGKKEARRQCQIAQRGRRGGWPASSSGVKAGVKIALANATGAFREMKSGSSQLLS